MTENPQEHSDVPPQAIPDTVIERGSDDRRHEVNPADSPAPSSPEPDERALREGEEQLDRVKPY